MSKFVRLNRYPTIMGKTTMLPYNAPEVEILELCSDRTFCSDGNPPKDGIVIPDIETGWEFDFDS